MSVAPDWESARVLVYDLFTVTDAPMDLQYQLRERFKEKNVFLEVIDALSSIDKPPRSRTTNGHSTRQKAI